MPELSLAELSAATGGSLLRGDGETRVSTFTIDTRKLQPGGVFFALAGEHTDGHRFLGEAQRRGAAAAVIERKPESEQTAPAGLILVDAAAAALSACGELARRKLNGMTRVAVTGSNGKTTTKELLAEGLSGARRVYRTPGNYNNHLGVPLTLLGCPAGTEIAVLELAMSAAGEIADLTRLTDPHIGLVTNVRAAHLGPLGSLDDIAAAKGEMFAMLRSESTAVVNLDDTHVRVQAARHDGKRVTFGQHRDADVRMIDLENRFVPGATFKFQHEGQVRQAQLRIGGAHAAFDALAALAAVVAVGADLDAAVAGMQRVEPGDGRGRVHRLADQMLLIDDSYNSSPSALSSMLETMRLSEPPGRKVLVMGDMLELGSYEEALHREAGRRAANAGVELLVGVGRLSRGCAEAARRAGVREVHHHADSAKAAESVAEFLRPGDLIVVKGSHSMKMELVVRAILSQLGDGH